MGMEANPTADVGQTAWWSACGASVVATLVVQLLSSKILHDMVRFPARPDVSCGLVSSTLLKLHARLLSLKAVVVDSE